MIRNETSLIGRAARLFNVQTAHYDGFGQRVEPPAEAILTVLRILGAPVEKMSDLSAAIRERHQFLWRRVIEPVVTTWEGNPCRIKLRLPSSLADAAVNYEIELEGGAVLRGQCHKDLRSNPVQRCVEGINFVARPLEIPEKPPSGYHRLHLRIGGLAEGSACCAPTTYLFVAPFHAYGKGVNPAKSWGVFCPVYALGSQTNWGVGDISDLESLLDLAGDLGAGTVGTLPLLAAFLDEPFNPSPYAPVSRFFWNELFLDVSRITELPDCPAAQAMIDSPALQGELQELRASRYVDYRRAMALKRGVLEQLLGCLLDKDSERRTQFQRFVASHALAQDYAAFRAKAERERATWQHWQEAHRNGLLRPGDYDDDARQYHLYVQWLADEQMQDLGEKTRGGGPALYLDFPLGVNRDGYDVWRERDTFALAASGGAPPDGFFTRGQNWGFPPLHPEGLRAQGYRYYIHCLRHHLRYAKMLRIDHVMGLHRSYWVPAGFAATEGVYVRYPAEELYAVLNLESHRHKALIIGENLGTVPPHINAALEQHGIRGMHVSQFGVRPDSQTAMEKPPRHTVASLNTHDTATFAGFITGADIDDRVVLGLLTGPDSAPEHNYRAAQRNALATYLNAAESGAAAPEALLEAWLSALAHSEAELLLVNLEDLWLEPLPQNVPGTWDERPNWMRKARYSLEEIRRMPELQKLLITIDDIRRNRR
jgi:4-alpha-glucanotransferase